MSKGMDRKKETKKKPGKTLEEMYPAWIETMRSQYGKQAREIRERGVPWVHPPRGGDLPRALRTRE